MVNNSRIEMHLGAITLQNKFSGVYTSSQTNELFYHDVELGIFRSGDLVDIMNQLFSDQLIKRITKPHLRGLPSHKIIEARYNLIAYQPAIDRFRNRNWLMYKAWDASRNRLDITKLHNKIIKG